MRLQLPRYLMSIEIAYYDYYYYLCDIFRKMVNDPKCKMKTAWNANSLSDKLNLIELYPLRFESNWKPTPQMYVIFIRIWIVLSGLGMVVGFVGFACYRQRKIIDPLMCESTIYLNSNAKRERERERNAPCCFCQNTHNDKLKRRREGEKNILTHTHTHTRTRTTYQNTRLNHRWNITAYRVKLNELWFWFSIWQNENAGQSIF